MKVYPQETIVGREFIAGEALLLSTSLSSSHTRSLLLPHNSFYLYPNFMALLQATFLKDTVTSGPHTAEQGTTIVRQHLKLLKINLSWMGFVLFVTAELTEIKSV